MNTAAKKNSKESRERVNFELQEFAWIPADDRLEMKFTFGGSKKFANVYIFEAIKKERDARVMEISGMVFSETKNPAF